MRFVAFCAVISALIAGRSFGEEFFEAGEEPSPNHLVPMRSFMREKRAFLGDYNELLVKYLIVTKGELGRMLVRPSFASEFCLSVDVEHVENPAEKDDLSKPLVNPFADDDSSHSKTEKKRPQDVTSETKEEENRYSITVTTAVKSIWGARWKAEENKKPILVKIERVDRKINRDLAVAIQRVWAKALLLTRYPATTQNAQRSFDGTTYQFSVGVCGFGTLEGETWSPKRGLPLDLTNIGLDLVAFARLDANGKKMTEKQLIDRLRKLESTIPQR